MTRTFLPLFRQRGVSVITAIFLLLLLAGLAALMANVISTAHTTSAEDVLGARAYQAARTGVEWGLYKVLEAPEVQVAESRPAACIPPTETPPSLTVPLNDCPNTSFPGADLNGFEVSVHCERMPSAKPYESEGCRMIRFFRLTATARGPGPAGLTIEREVQVSAEKCIDAAKDQKKYSVLDCEY